MLTSVASPEKVARHHERLDAYLRGEAVFPISLELDITSMCSRSCQDCPSSRSDFQHTLPMDFIEKLLAALEGPLKGLLLSGGEATIAPHFPAVLAEARRRGVQDLAVVTNGSQLAVPRVAEALLEHASTIRISLYDWDGSSCGDIAPTLARIEGLRGRIERAGSRLKLGVSVLTDSSRVARLAELGEAVKNAGAHWVYYHPMCTGWGTGHLVQLDQSGVLDAVTAYQQHNRNGFNVSIAPERYLQGPLAFSSYHAAHFLMVVGADGKNYLGAEVKYQERFAIADLLPWRDGFLHEPERLARIAAVDSRTYSALASRHRGVLYSHLIESAARGGGHTPDVEQEFSFPFIL